MKLLRYIFKRFIGVIPILIIISFVSFELMNLAPGDPAEAILTSQGAVVTADVLESTRIEMGLDKPVFQQYLNWMKLTLSLISMCQNILMIKISNQKVLYEK